MVKYVLVLSATLLFSCSKGPKLNDVDLLKKSHSLLGQKQTVPVVDHNEVALGKVLFQEVALSGNNTQSCNSCHNVSNYGVDNTVTSLGSNGAPGRRNTPTVYNAVYSTSQFWDGRASNLKEQAGGPINNPKEMNSSPSQVESKLKLNENYVRTFKYVYNREPFYEGVLSSIAAYESTLVSNGTSKFDVFLSGRASVLNNSEKRGLEHFLNYGCVACHSGNNLGGRSYAKFGVLHPYSNTSDTGRHGVTGSDADRYVFKVPSLRNVEKTYPYFHDGGEPTLEGAVRTMAYTQLGRELSEEEVNELVAFLKTLTDNFESVH